MAAAPEKLVVWMFPDEKGNQHPAVIVSETMLAGVPYALAVSDLPGLTVLQKQGGTYAVVKDRAVVDALSASLRAVVEGGVEPVLVFQAAGADGKPATFTAERLVSHAGRSYLPAVDGAGSRAVFALPARAGDAPTRVTDKATLDVVGLLASAPAEPEPTRVTLTLPDGNTRGLTVVHRTRLGARAYAIATDDARGDAYVLREEPGDRYVPVTDAREVERVRARMDGRAGG